MNDLASAQKAPEPGLTALHPVLIQDFEKLSAAHPVAALIAADVEQRAAFGIKKYGVPLMTFNGRNALIDAYQEMLDFAIYALQYIIEESGPPRMLLIMRGMYNRALYDCTLIREELDRTNADMPTAEKERKQ